LTPTSVPLAVNIIRTGGPLAYQESVAQSIRDVREANLGIAEEQSIMLGLICSFNAKIIGEGYYLSVL
jgi:hypothetical protein